MPDGHPPPADNTLRRVVLELWPLAEVDAVAGLKARHRDPREMPGTGGEQRDAAAALDAASDRGSLTAHREAHRRLQRLDPSLRPLALWLASWGGAVRKGAVVTVAALVAHYAATSGPLALREDALAAAEAHRAASVHHAGLKRIAAHKLTREKALAIDKARTAEASAAAWDHRAADALDAWARARITAFLPAWEATAERADDDTCTEG